jgi:hypothetical protein
MLLMSSAGTLRTTNLIAGVTMTITARFTGTVFRSRWPDVVIPPMSLPQFLLVR